MSSLPICKRIAGSAVLAATACLFVTGARAQAPIFSPPVLLPGDTAIGAADGQQLDADIARGDNQSLAVWSDYRSNPLDIPGFQTEGTGADIYAARLDADGSVVDTSPIVINQDFGEQDEPAVAFNGTNWLVVWRTDIPALPTYQRIMAARVAPDGTVLDDPPIEVQADQSFYENFEPIRVAGGADGWVVMFQGNGPVGGVLAKRVAGDGTLPDPTPTLIHSTFFMTEFDLAFAGDEYLIAWSDPFDIPRARRYTSDLQPIGGSFIMPGAERVATDGTDFLVIWASEFGPGGYVRGAIVDHGGTASPQFDIRTGLQYATCCLKAGWDGTTYWAGWTNSVARITPTGVVLDPNGFPIGNDPAAYSRPLDWDGALGGGLHVVWNDGEDGALYPKDTYATAMAADGQVQGDSLLSAGAPAQLEADFAEGPGMFAVAFESRISGVVSVKVQRLDTTGAALDAEPIEVAGGPNVGNPGVAFDGTRYMITWHDGNTIFARRMLTDGTLLDDPPITVMTGLTPDVAGIDGTFLVVGTHYQTFPQERVAFTRRVDGATGALLDASPQEIGSFVLFAQFPHVVTFGNRWLVVYQTNLSHDSSIAGTKGAFVELDGSNNGAFIVDLGWRPDVAVSGDRALFVSVSHTIASTHADILGRVMLADGSFPGTYFTISDATDRQVAPAVVFDGNEFLVAWEDKRHSVIYFDERTDIYGARVAIDGTVLDPAGFALTDSPAPELDPALISAGGTKLLAASIFVHDSGLCAQRIGIHTDGFVPRAADANRDGTVDFADILQVIGAWGPCPPVGTCDEDVNGDGLVGFADILAVIADWD